MRYRLCVCAQYIKMSYVLLDIIFFENVRFWELLGDKNNGGINGRKSLAMTTASPTNPTIIKTKNK